MMTGYDESVLLSQLSGCDGDVSAKANRLIRKLKVRRLQVEHGQSGPWNLTAKLDLPLPSESLKALDCLHTSSASAGASTSASQERRLLIPKIPPKCIISPYTGRVLKPFILRTRNFKTTRSSLNEELTKGKIGRSKSIDFCYVQKHHIEAVNEMAREFFWPGIDVSECLACPDFSCVAMYGQLVIGFSILLPNVSHTEAYISFVFTHPEWRRAGIGNFLVYHLIQACSGMDIVLHVSANNPAVMLYQKFGFKVEERVLNFYDKYLPPNSTECRHALFLRLQR